MKISFRSRAILVCVLGFYAFYFVSALLYPGGTWEDKTTVGYSFCSNYVCDAWQPTALNGLPNPGRIGGVISIGMYLAALFLMYNLLAKFLAEYSLRLSRVVLTASFLVLIGCFLVSVVFPPEGDELTYHSVILMITFLCGVLAIVLPLVCFLQMSMYRRLGRVGFFLFSPVIVNLFCYVLIRLGVMTWWQGEALLVNLQKISTIAVSMLALLIAHRNTQMVTTTKGK